jgi:hypothetical protein
VPYNPDMQSPSSLVPVDPYQLRMEERLEVAVIVARDNSMPYMIPASEWPARWLIKDLSPDAPDFLKDLGNQPDFWMRTELPKYTIGYRYTPVAASPRPGGRWVKDELDGAWRFAVGRWLPSGIFEQQAPGGIVVVI